MTRQDKKPGNDKLSWRYVSTLSCNPVAQVESVSCLSACSWAPHLHLTERLNLNRNCPLFCWWQFMFWALFGNVWNRYAATRSLTSPACMESGRHQWISIAASCLTYASFYIFHSSLASPVGHEICPLPHWSWQRLLPPAPQNSPDEPTTFFSTKVTNKSGWYPRCSCGNWSM